MRWPKVFVWAGLSFPTPYVPVLPPSVLEAPSRWMREWISRQIKEFEESLNDQEEIGMSMVLAGTSETFHIEDVGSWGPPIGPCEGPRNLVGDSAA